MAHFVKVYFTTNYHLLYNSVHVPLCMYYMLLAFISFSSTSRVGLEFRSQLDSLLSLLLQVPQLVLERVRQQHWQALEEACEQLITTYHEEIEQLAREKVR